MISFRLPDSRGYFVFDLFTNKKTGTSEHIHVLDYIISEVGPANGPFPFAIKYALQQVYPDAIITVSLPENSMQNEEGVVY